LRVRSGHSEVLPDNYNGPDVSSVVAVGRRHLPRGWSDLGLQLAIWFGFAAGYQVVRGIVDQRPPEVAFQHGYRVLQLETDVFSRLYELTLQNFVEQRHLLADAVSWTYWNSEFTVVGLAVLFVYLRRHEHFTRFRNSILLANVIGLAGYAAYPTAPPRMLGIGFVDSHRDGLVSLVANPYAAMPSLHAADALIVGIVLAAICRSLWAKALWAAWPAWVWFAVMATGNHFWLDCLAGVGVAVLAMVVVYRDHVRAAFAARRT
jgi:PAP2 superfamily